LGSGKIRKVDYPHGKLRTTQMESKCAVKKKDLSGPFPEAYQRADVEEGWDVWWEQMGFYKPKVQAGPDNFVMVIPPPNVTGTLHLGHALMCSVEDAICRYHRMCGKNVLWVPGIDHAGIATQSVVELQLWKHQKLTRHDLGREKFLEKVWEWKNDNGNFIGKQIRRLGCSADWDRHSFTMDEHLCKAVVEAFKRMHAKGVIYRANKLVNWSCALNTAISNIEVEQIELKGPEFLKVPGHTKGVEFGVIHSFAYKLADNPDEELVVATTRIETMLGDVAVAIHPDDPRYKKFHGRKLKHPFHDRLLDIVLDPVLVNMEFGTGAVKVTPAHDPNDFECGKRNKLEMINIFTDEGKLNENGGKFSGMMRYDARRAVISELEQLGLYKGKEANPMVLGKCSRSGDIIEPLLKPQWWVNCADMAKRSTDAVRNGELEILPKSAEKVWFHWLDNIQEWCISRQLWWGHRIPAYRILIDGKKPEDDSENSRWAVGSSYEEALKVAHERFADFDPKSITLEQDEDVLDTWFSSGLFPFSVFRWPEQTEDLKAFYPTTLLETGHDILFFWVARMVMMGLELTDTLPFKTVFLHPMVRDKYGKKMSKGKGNVIDPIAVIEGSELEALHEQVRKGNIPAEEVEKAIKAQKKDYPKGIPECGADALRFALLDYMVQERNINLDVDRVLGYRQFCNKLWQGTRYALSYLDSSFRPSAEIDSNSLTFEDKWVLSRLTNAAKICNEAFAQYKFTRATSAVFDFWTKEFCPVYVEAIKRIMSSNDTVSKKRVSDILYICIDWTLKLTHPIMPFVTEELWQRLPGRKENESIMIESYPQYKSSWDNAQIDEEMKLTLDIIHAVNSARASMDIPNSARPKAFVKCLTQTTFETARLGSEISETISKLTQLEVLNADAEVPSGCISAVVNAHVTLNLAVDGLINVDKQISKLDKQVGVLTKWIDAKEKMTSQPNYIEKTPEDVKEKHSLELNEKRIEKEQMEESLAKLRKLKL
jgi:valyl-tRNA synthetase